MRRRSAATRHVGTIPLILSTKRLGATAAAAASTSAPASIHRIFFPSAPNGPASASGSGGRALTDRERAALRGDEDSAIMRLLTRRVAGDKSTVKSAPKNNILFGAGADGGNPAAAPNTAPKQSSNPAPSSSSSVASSRAFGAAAPTAKGTVAAGWANTSTTTTNSTTSARAERQQRGAASQPGKQSQQGKGTPMAMVLAEAASQPLPPIAPCTAAGLWDSIARNVRLVTEFNSGCRTRRLHRLGVALKFLRDHHVILHSPLRWAPSAALQAEEEAATAAAAAKKKVKNASDKVDAGTKDEGDSKKNKKKRGATEGSDTAALFLRGEAAGTWNVSGPFNRLALLGEVVLRSEVDVRLMKLFPRRSGSSPTDEGLAQEEEGDAGYDALRRRCLEPAALAALFDDVAAARIIERDGRRRSPPTVAQKAGMMFAMLAELHWFCARTRANDRTHNNALFPPSDVLILHVIAAHAVETLLAECVFQHLARPLETIRSTALPAGGDDLVSSVMAARRRPARSGHQNPATDGSPSRWHTPGALDLFAEPVAFDSALHGRRLLLCVGEGKEAEELSPSTQAAAAEIKVPSGLVADTSRLDATRAAALAAMNAREDALAETVTRAKLKAEAALSKLLTDKNDGTKPEEEKQQKDAADAAESESMLRRKIVHCERQLACQMKRIAAQTADIERVYAAAPPVVQPLLHRVAADPKALARVDQSDVVLNYRRYRAMDLPPVAARTGVLNPAQALTPTAASASVATIESSPSGTARWRGPLSLEATPLTAAAAAVTADIPLLNTIRSALQQRSQSP